MINRAWARGYKLMGAFENEFVLLNLVRTRAVDQTVFAQTNALGRMAPVLNAITEALAEQGVFAEQLYGEAGGQFEMPVRYRDALAAADQQVVFRETVRAVAHQHGLIRDVRSQTARGRGPGRRPPSLQPVARRQERDPTPSTLTTSRPRWGTSSAACFVTSPRS